MNVGSILMREVDNKVFVCTKSFLGGRFKIEGETTDYYGNPGPLAYVIELHNEEKQEYISVDCWQRIFVAI